MTDLQSRLASLPGVGGLDESVLADLAETGRVVPIPAGWTPIHQQEPADKAYVVLDGRLCVVRDGREVAEIGVGELAGEMGLVDHRLRNAQLTAEGPVQVLAWPRDLFQELRARHDSFDQLVRDSAGARRG